MEGFPRPSWLFQSWHNYQDEVPSSFFSLCLFQPWEFTPMLHWKAPEFTENAIIQVWELTNDANPDVDNK
jgi:hypothetical protein